MGLGRRMFTVESASGLSFHNVSRYTYSYVDIIDCLKVYRVDNGILNINYGYLWTEYLA